VTEAAEQPDALVRVLEGNPSDEELAALVAVVATELVPPGPGPSRGRRSEWGAPLHKLRGPHRHGPGAWRASAWPR
jgi:hypothetical protein